MRWVSYLSPQDDKPHPGLVRDSIVLGLRRPTALVDMLADDGLLPAAAHEVLTDPFEAIAESEARLCAPIPVPPSIRDFMAFEEHVVTSTRALGRSMEPGWYEIPVFYFSNPAAIRGPRDDVEISPGSSRFDYELEVAAVIGRSGRGIAVADAEAHIAGYSIFCDWSARDHQAQEMRQGLGPAKGKDGATTMGPYLVTPDELTDRRTARGYDLRMTASVNGRTYSAGNLADLHWTFAQMISYASRGTQLRPGDIIASGTVGTGCILELSLSHGEQSYPWLRPGDTVVLEVERLGSTRSTIRPAPPVQPLK